MVFNADTISDAHAANILLCHGLMNSVIEPHPQSVCALLPPLVDFMTRHRSAHHTGHRGNILASAASHLASEHAAHDSADNRAHTNATAGYAAALLACFYHVDHAI